MFVGQTFKTLSLTQKLEPKQDTFLLLIWPWPRHDDLHTRKWPRHSKMHLHTRNEVPRSKARDRTE